MRPDNELLGLSSEIVGSFDFRETTLDTCGMNRGRFSTGPEGTREPLDFWSLHYYPYKRDYFSFYPLKNVT